MAPPARRERERELAQGLVCLLVGALVGACERPEAPAAETGPFAPTVEGASAPLGQAPEGMIWVPGGEFSLGSDASGDSLCHMPGLTDDARPIHRVFVDGFWMDRTEVTNAQYSAFVRATGYVTIAERTPTEEEFPGVPPEDLVPGSTVFTPTDAAVPLDDYFQWWRYEPGADWRHPEGRGSSLEGRAEHPVVQIAYADAMAYAEWAGKRLPTEAEWEFAARAGAPGQLYPWGDELEPGGAWAANIWQGTFPVQDSGADGFAGLAPVARFAPNGYGLHDMAGNVWEWCSDWYRPDTYAARAQAGGVVRNPVGPDSSFDPAAPNEQKRVQRGGSFLCTPQYCTRYMVGTRGKGEISTGSNHVGFRCVKVVGAGQPAR